MYIYSELLNQKFETVKDCEKAEKEYQAKLDEKKAQQALLKEQRAERAKVVEDAYQKAIDANKAYHDVLDDFLKDYGSFHVSYHEGDMDNLFKSLFRLF